MSKTSKASLPPQSMLHAIKQPDDYLCSFFALEYTLADCPKYQDHFILTA